MSSFTDSDHGRLKDADRRLERELERLDESLLNINTRLDMQVKQIETLSDDLVRAATRGERTDRDLSVNTEATKRVEKAVERIEANTAEMVTYWGDLRGFGRTVARVVKGFGWLVAISVPTGLLVLAWGAVRAFLGI